MSRRKGRNRKNPDFMCGHCRESFYRLESAENHARAAHAGKLVHIMGVSKILDMRPEHEPSIAEQVLEQRMNAYMGEPVEDWAADIIELEENDCYS